jgi:hypothetical protein
MLAPPDHWAAPDLRAALRYMCEAEPALLEIQIRIRCVPHMDELTGCFNHTGLEGPEAGTGHLLSEVLTRVLARKGNR